MSTKVACAAPRDRASSPNAPVPLQQSVPTWTEGARRRAVLGGQFWFVAPTDCAIRRIFATELDPADGRRSGGPRRQGGETADALLGGSTLGSAENAESDEQQTGRKATHRGKPLNQR